jgi:hypothetical protein
MSAHNAVFNLGQDQKGTLLDGAFLLIKEGAEPVDGASGDTGYAKGALCINIGGAAQANLFINTGTAAAPVWKYIEREG